MPATAEITEPLIRENITRAVSDVFKTMLGRVPAFVGSAPPPQSVRPRRASFRNQDRQLYVVGTVGFIGDINGLIYLYLEEPFARLCTCQLLGMTEAGTRRLRRRSRQRCHRRTHQHDGGRLQERPLRRRLSVQAHDPVDSARQQFFASSRSAPPPATSISFDCGGHRWWPTSS